MGYDIEKEKREAIEAGQRALSSSIAKITPLHLLFIIDFMGSKLLL